MLNLFRMEVYKIFREKSIYITAAAILGVIFIALATMKVITSPDLLHSAMESGYYSRGSSGRTGIPKQYAGRFSWELIVFRRTYGLPYGNCKRHLCLRRFYNRIREKYFFLLSQKKLVYYKQINDFSHCQRVFPDCFYPAYLPVFSPYGV